MLLKLACKRLNPVGRRMWPCCRKILRLPSNRPFARELAVLAQAEAAGRAYDISLGLPDPWSAEQQAVRAREQAVLDQADSARRAYLGLPPLPVPATPAPLVPPFSGGLPPGALDSMMGPLQAAPFAVLDAYGQATYQPPSVPITPVVSATPMPPPGPTDGVAIPANSISRINFGGGVFLVVVGDDVVFAGRENQAVAAFNRWVGFRRTGILQDELQNFRSYPSFPFGVRNGRVYRVQNSYAR